jgi:hypothetical protein
VGGSLRMVSPSLRHGSTDGQRLREPTGAAAGAAVERERELEIGFSKSRGWFLDLYIWFRK